MSDFEKEKTVAEIVEKIKSTLHSQATSVDYQHLSHPASNPIQHYSVSDFLLYQDKEFIQYAYRIILGREPDSQGLNNYLNQLRKGVAKIDLLYGIYSAQEARHSSVKIRGLYSQWFLQKLFRLPIIGYISRLVSGLFMLPVFIRNFENLDTFVKVQLSNNIANILSKEIPLSQKHFYDELYVAFEDKFRGSRSDIKARFEVYLPYIANLKDKLGSLSILDIGCGRGEWLELLKQNNYLAQGIDSNSLMIETCRQSDLNVSEADAMEFLKNTPSNSFDLITGFHIVEHLPFPVLVDFLSHIYRCLKPHGMILLETPNPENIITGACDFYTDFTHIHPVPLNSLMFLAEFQGFCDSSILRLHEDTTVTLDTPYLQKLLYGPRDYALIAFKL